MAWHTNPPQEATPVFTTTSKIGTTTRTRSSRTWVAFGAMPVSGLSVGRMLWRRSCCALGFCLVCLLGVSAPAGAVSVTQFPLRDGSVPLGITAGADGNMWFAEVSGSRIGRIKPSGRIDDWSTGSGISSGSEPWGIVAGPDGNLWFTEQAKSQVGQMSPTSLTASEFAAGAGISANSGPRGIAVGPDRAIWFAEDAGRIGRILFVPGGGLAFTEFSRGITAGSRPLGMLSAAGIRHADVVQRRHRRVGYERRSRSASGVLRVGSCAVGWRQAPISRVRDRGASSRRLTRSPPCAAGWQGRRTRRARQREERLRRQRRLTVQQSAGQVDRQLPRPAR